MRIDFNVEIKTLKEEEVLGGPLIAADQLSNLVVIDRGESAATGREAFQLNALMEKIACAKEPIDVSANDLTLLQKVLDNALANHRISTFIVGRLFGILDGQTSEQGEDTQAE